MSIILSLSLITLCAAAANEVPSAVPIAMSPSFHPRVFQTESELNELRNRIETQAWAGEIKTKLLDEAERLMSRPVKIPHEGGQWVHWYTCKEDGGTLQAESPVKHVCTLCGAVYSGFPYDQVYVTHQHGYYLGGIKTLGLAYVIAGNPAYAERIREILLEYATFYSTLPLHDVNNKPNSGARLLAQTLDESTLLCQMVLGYDLAYRAPCFSEADHDAIRDHLLLPMTATIKNNPRGISNWQSWHNAAVGCVGFLLGDPELADWAINGPFGFLYQMSHSLLPSGIWYEECPSYHFYALSAHIYLMESALRAGVNLYEIPRVKKMFDAPVRQLLPDLTFVPFHDSDRISILDQREFYEVAYKRYGDLRYPRLMTQRAGLWALLWGADTLPSNSPDNFGMKSSIGEEEGLAVLRDSANQTAVYLDFGPGRSGHVQPAKLNMVLYALDTLVFPDPGRIPYGNPLHKEWFRQTIAHNTVTVNQKSQKISGCHLAAFSLGETHSLCRAVCTSAYNEPIGLDRTLLLNENIIVDVFRCSSEKESTFDWALHFEGTLRDAVESELMEELGGDNGYQHLKNIRRCTSPLNRFTIETGKDKIIHVQCFGGTESYLAEGYGENMKSLLPMVIRRAKGNAACFVAVYQIINQESAPLPAKVNFGKKTVVEIDDLALSISRKAELKINRVKIPVHNVQ